MIKMSPLTRQSRKRLARLDLRLTDEEVDVEVRRVTALETTRMRRIVNVALRDQYGDVPKCWRQWMARRLLGMHN